MDEAVNPAPLPRRLSRRLPQFLPQLLLAALLLATAGAGRAQALPDPTRPAPVALPGGPAAAAVGAAPRLQTVLLSREPGGRHLAVIDGETVRLGQRFQGARVVRIASDRVELLRGRQRSILRLYPDKTADAVPAVPALPAAAANPAAQP